MSIFAKTRKFGGKRYRLHASYYTLRKAREATAALRKSGWNARRASSRIVEERHSKHLSSETRKYPVYKRRKK